jgi:cytochrome c-type biogenesis protein CcmF
MMSVLGLIRVAPGMVIAHSGFALLIIGIMLSATLSEESDVRMRPGNASWIGPYQFFFVNTQEADGANYRGIRAAFEVIKNKHHITTLYPEKRIYTVRDMVMTKVAIHPGLFRDLYIALGEPLDQGFWSVRIYYKPFIRWIWLGGILMLCGGMIACFPKRKMKWA